ncbi:low molecular weight protein-tyrosine-phosphatase [Desertimonas flava]|jgi:protein-tyrosine-phosphatase|uniref:low molecular weight protein-tyrosine-phosphatase n=1 Tax=Desertimonas flava TaxID=2064846 RepID=UPI000E3454EA|nr:low molecular weight protein-tyrosine-phosphatase [Desertimonas flava]
MRVLFVCLGNICRSPAAEAVFAALAADRGVAVEVDSAGTSDYHIGETPHQHTLAEARRRGVPIDHRARQVTDGDFRQFDLLVAVDGSTARNLERMAPAGADLGRIVTLEPAVADPWGHPPSAYAEMWDQLEEQCGELLDRIATAAEPA